MNLVIVESPTKARTLSKFLGQDFRIEPTMGHVMDLPKSKLGVDIEHEFAPEYVLVSKKESVVDRIKKEAKKAGKIYLATDPDREGEAIAYHVADLLGAGPVGSSSSVRMSLVGRLPAGARRRYSALRSRHPHQVGVSRVVFHEITESAVKHALENPRGIDMDLFHAQQARRVLDRLVGYKLSPLLWRKVRRGLSAGRVQSVTLRLIVEREREIEVFKSEEYWEIFVEVSKVSEVDHFVVKLVERDGEKIKVRTNDEAGTIVHDLESATYGVASIDKREVSRKPPAPFTTSTMAQSASRNFFWPVKKTMFIAQKLYEEGFITYHRTDSLSLAKEAVFAARDYIKREFGENFVGEKPRFYKTTSKVAQEAHEAVRPTDVNVMRNTQNVTRLGADGEKLYGLIWKRFVACQMVEARFDETTISVEAIRETQEVVRYMLQASGQVMKFAGWKAVYGKTEMNEEGVVQLPEVKEGEQLQLVKVDPQQKFTQPPPRYTEASLIKTLEKLGIGRPSTYAPTISTILARMYVEKEEGKFLPTAVGVAVNGFLVGYFPDVVNYEFTAKMEGDLDEIANGEKKWVPFIGEFWGPFNKKVEGVGEKAKRVRVEAEEAGEKCPKCGDSESGREVIRVGRFGKFLSCSRFPDCDWKEKYLEKIGMKCPECKTGDVIVKKTRKGRIFYGCSTYPKCKWASWRKPAILYKSPTKPVGQEEWEALK